MTEWVVFSDLHGNLAALRSFLETEYPDGKRQFVFLGDIAGYYYEAAECAALLKKVPGLIALKGNHDRMYLDSFSDPELTERLAARYGSSYRKKNEELRDYLSSLPEQLEINLGRIRILLQHGSPEDPLEGRVYPDTELPRLPSDQMTVVLSGHTHYQMERRQGNTIWINPGSLGQPRDGKGFSYCILRLEETEGTAATAFRRVTPRLERLESQIREYDPEQEYLLRVLHRND